MASPDDHVDHLILRLFETDDDKAITILHQTYAEILYRTANAILEDESAASEVLQELLIAIWEKRHRLQISIPIKNYLLKAITNRCLNFLRNHRKRRTMFIRDHAILESHAVNPEIEAALYADDLRQLIQQTKLALPPKTRLVFTLSRSLHMSYKEIAAHLDISQKSVEKHITKALVIFRKMRNQYLNVLFPLLCIMYENWKDCQFDEVGSVIHSVCYW